MENFMSTGGYNVEMMMEGSGRLKSVHLIVVEPIIRKEPSSHLYAAGIETSCETRETVRLPWILISPEPD